MIRLVAIILLAITLNTICPNASAATAAKPGVEVLYISEKNVYPQQITRPKGPFYLVIKNHSPLRGLVMHVKLAAAGPQVDLATGTLDDFNGNFAILIDPPPGTYSISDPSQPSLKFNLTITN